MGGLIWFDRFFFVSSKGLYVDFWVGEGSSLIGSLEVLFRDKKYGIKV